MPVNPTGDPFTKAGVGGKGERHWSCKLELREKCNEARDFENKTMVLQNCKKKTKL